MKLKDYYAILNLESSATQAEIKKAYRRMALEYHPDKKPGDPYAATLFAEIKEAYEVLTNPSKKEYYLQQRWYQQSTGRRNREEAVTPLNLLKQVLELERYVATLDHFRMDKQGLEQYILGLVPDAHIQALHAFGEAGTNREIIRLLLKSLSPLPPAYREKIMVQLGKLATGDAEAGEQISRADARAKQKHRKEKYSVIIILAVTVALCFFIWLAGR